MSAATNVETARDGTRVPWGDVLLSAIASVSWALIGMAGTAALGLHLLEADSAGSLGPMTAAVVALGAGGSVTPSGDVSAFGLTGAEANTAIEITPLGVSLVGALLLSYFFLRSLRAAGVVIAPAELLARAGAVVALFVAMLGGLAWAGHDVITIDGSSLGLDDLPGGGGGGVEIPGLGDIGDIGGLLPDRIGELIDAKAAVGFTVDTAPTLLGGLGWSAGILLIALLASRRTPLPRGWEAVHRVVRPAASALVTVLLVAVAAGFAAAAYAAAGDDHPRRIAGAALLGAPNGVWLGVPVGLLVPWNGRATGEAARLLPDPLDDLLRVDSGRSVTLGRLAELDGRVWLLGVAAALMMLLAGVLTAVRTPAARPAAGGWPLGGASEAAFRAPKSGGVRTAAAGAGSASDSASTGNRGALGFAGRCALRLGVATALALPLLAWLTEVSVDASLSVLGFDAFGAGIELHGHLGMALLLGALWGAGAGAAGALLARASGAAGQRAAPLARGDVAGTPVEGAAYPQYAGQAGRFGPYTPSTPYRPPNPATNPYLRVPDELRPPGEARPPGGGPMHGEGHLPPGGAPASGQPRPPGDSPRYDDARRPGGPAGPGPAGSAHDSRGHTERWQPDTAHGPGQNPPPSNTPRYDDARRPGGPAGPGPAGSAHDSRGHTERWQPDTAHGPGQNPPPSNTPRHNDTRRPGGPTSPSPAGSAHDTRGHTEPRQPDTADDPGTAPGACPAGSDGEVRPSDETRPQNEGWSPGEGRSEKGSPPSGDDVYGAPTVARPISPPPRGPRQPPRARPADRPPSRPDDGPPPPPPPPPPPRPDGGG